jgi:hypothetical protein
VDLLLVIDENRQLVLGAGQRKADSLLSCEQGSVRKLGKDLVQTLFIKFPVTGAVNGLCTPRQDSNGSCAFSPDLFEHGKDVLFG